jgi:hypothetical protein
MAAAPFPFGWHAAIVTRHAAKGVT